MDTGMELVTFDAGGPSDGLVERAFEKVLRPSFVPAELPGIEALVADGAVVYNTLVASRDGEPVGAACWTDPVGDVALLGYLAVRPGLRSGGVGTRLLQRLAELWAERAVPVVLGEVHDPRFHERTEHEDPGARLAFYDRCGARLLDLPWRQPSLAPGQPRVDGMLLISLAGPLRSADPSLPAEPIGQWVELYYAGEEGEVPSDAGYRELLARVGSRPTVPLMDIGQYHSVQPLRGPESVLPVPPEGPVHPDSQQE